jgi:hypothetical protein
LRSDLDRAPYPGVTTTSSPSTNFHVGCTAHYGVGELVSFKVYITVIAGEKVLKKGWRDWKIRSKDPEWIDVHHGMSN